MVWQAVIFQFPSIVWHTACFYIGVNSGSYSSIFRMAAGHAESVDAISQNLANCSTPGYRKVEVSHKVFSTLLGEAANASTSQKDGAAFDPMTVNFAQGSVQPTERPLDFALRGSGFFVVSKDGKDYYTRKGDFSLDPNGALLNSEGLEVQGEDGPIRLPSDTVLNELTVNDDGTLLAGGQNLGKLNIATFQDNSQLLRAGTTLFQAPQGVQPTSGDPGAKVSGRALEQSNTSVCEEMADLIKTVRAYEACQKMIQNDDDKTGKMIQQMG